MEKTQQTNLALKIGAILYLVWGMLHVWVGYDAVSVYHSATPYKGLWEMLIGGETAPSGKFQFATNTLTQNVQINFILNFCLDVAGAGLLGILIGLMLWRGVKPWLTYLIGFFIIGLIDLSFLTLQVLSGHIKANWETYGGPVIWFAAVVLLPFGLPKFKWKELI